MSFDMSAAMRANISVQHGDLKSVLGWCESNCKNEWKFDYGSHVNPNGNTDYDFFFESEKDYVSFLLWRK